MGKTGDLSHGMPLAVTIAMVSPAAQAAFSNPTLTDFLATSNVLKLVPYELADCSYGTEIPYASIIQLHCYNFSCYLLFS